MPFEDGQRADCAGDRGHDARAVRQNVAPRFYSISSRSNAANEFTLCWTSARKGMLDSQRIEVEW